jgi:hypothetical protein
MEIGGQSIHVIGFPVYHLPFVTRHRIPSARIIRDTPEVQILVLKLYQIGQTGTIAFEVVIAFKGYSVKSLDGYAAGNGKVRWLHGRISFIQTV